MLEGPMMAPHVAVDTVQYKVFLSGKSGVGKTSLAARLAGLSIPNVHYETTGGARTHARAHARAHASHTERMVLIIFPLQVLTP